MTALSAEVKDSTLSSVTTANILIFCSHFAEHLFSIVAQPLQIRIQRAGQHSDWLGNPCASVQKCVIGAISAGGSEPALGHGGSAAPARLGPGSQLRLGGMGGGDEVLEERRSSAAFWWATSPLLAMSYWTALACFTLCASYYSVDLLSPTLLQPVSERRGANSFDGGRSKRDKMTAYGPGQHAF